MTCVSDIRMTKSYVVIDFCYDFLIMTCEKHRNLFEEAYRMCWSSLEKHEGS